MPLLTAKYAEVFAKGAIVFLPQRKRSFTQSGFYVYAWFIINCKVRKAFRGECNCVLPQRKRSFPQRAERYFYAWFAKYAKLFAESAIVFYHKGNGVFHREQRGIFMHGSQSRQSFSRRALLCFYHTGNGAFTESKERFCVST